MTVKNHHDLVGKYAVHPFAFVGDDDPADDPENEVTAYKAWIDTSVGNALKIRNATNTAWLTVLAGGGGASSTWHALSPYTYRLTELDGSDDPPDLHHVDYI